jgi:hypothetical protein
MNFETRRSWFELQHSLSSRSTYRRRRLTEAKENRSNLPNSRGLGGEIR